MTKIISMTGTLLLAASTAQAGVPSRPRAERADIVAGQPTQQPSAGRLRGPQVVRARSGMKGGFALRDRLPASLAAIKGGLEDSVYFAAAPRREKVTYQIATGGATGLRHVRFRRRGEDAKR